MKVYIVLKRIKRILTVILINARTHDQLQLKNIYISKIVTMGVRRFENPNRLMIEIEKFFPTIMDTNRRKSRLI